MANELPYFRFTVSAWQNGKIALERYELQGLFIAVCGYYWLQDCSITLAMLQKKFSNATPEMFKELIELSIIKHENRHDKVQIEFLNIQYDLLSEKRKLRQIAGSRGGNAKAMLKQNPSYKDKDNNKDKEKDKDNADPLYFPILKLQTILNSEIGWQNEFEKNNGLKIGTCIFWLNKFFRKLSDEGETGKTIKDAKKHFRNWLLIELKKPENISKSEQKSSTVYKTNMPTE